jgi:hippurate hydrolase
MLEQRPGCYVWIGNGPADNGRLLHNPRYDFNDEILPLGATYFAKLVETLLPA